VYLDHNKALTDRYIIPALGPHTLGELPAVVIDDYSILLRDPTYRAASLDEKTRLRALATLTDDKGKVRSLGPDEVNQILNCIRDMYKELSLRDKSFKPDDNPVKAVTRHSNPMKRARGILRDDESIALYDEVTINDVWAGSQVMYAIALLAASTSIREGEIRGLQRQHVHLVAPFVDENGVPANGPWLMVRWTWQDKYGLAPTKNKRTRKVPLDSWTAKWLGIVMARSPYQESEDLVFAGNADKRVLRGFEAKPGRTPVDGHWIRDCFYAALSRIKINDTERRQRNIVFHSSRHYFVTRARNLPSAKDRQVQDITGQETLAVVDNYSHNEVDDTRHVVEGVVDKFRSAAAEAQRS
jgi:integrase